MDLMIKGNPYVPGTGNKPPHLAGRQEEKGKIWVALDRIMGQPDKHGKLDGVSPPLVLIGPRGVGKTVLLEWSRRRAEDLGIHCAVLDEEMLAGPEHELGEEILGWKEYCKAAKEFTVLRELGRPAATVVGVEGQMSHPTAVLSLMPLVDRKLEKEPLLVILDEAHAVAPELLKPFCETTQRFVQSGRPLALLLSGTPGLRAVLRGIEATFVEGVDFMPMNLLAEDEARDALSIPAADTGVPMDKDALETLVEWSDCYPFFIQQAGRHAWNVAKGRGAGKIAMEDAIEALKLVGLKRRDYFEGRFMELVDREIDSYALQEIDLIEKQPGRQVSYQELIDGFKDANKGLEYKKVIEIYESLLNLGFIYKGVRVFEAGIPSMFDYFREQKKPRSNGQ